MNERQTDVLNLEQGHPMEEITSQTPQRVTTISRGAQRVDVRRTLEENESKLSSPKVNIRKESLSSSSDFNASKSSNGFPQGMKWFIWDSISDLYCAFWDEEKIYRGARIHTKVSHSIKRERKKVIVAEGGRKLSASTKSENYYELCDDFYWRNSWLKKGKGKTQQQFLFEIILGFVPFKENMKFYVFPTRHRITLHKGNEDWEIEISPGDMGILPSLSEANIKVVYKDGTEEKISGQDLSNYGFCVRVKDVFIQKKSIIPFCCLFI
jgi:hypothetical protein